MGRRKFRKINPRSPWVVDLAELPRGSGNEVELARKIPLTEGWGSEVAEVAAERTVHLVGTLDSVQDGIFLAAQASAEMTAQCARCLHAFTAPVTARLDELFLYPEAVARAKDDGDEEAAELPRVIDNYLDLEQVTRDALVGELPFSPLCQADCAGLCPDCGILLRDAEPEHSHLTVDPRWQALNSLREQFDSDTEVPGEK